MIAVSRKVTNVDLGLREGFADKGFDFASLHRHRLGAPSLGSSLDLGGLGTAFNASATSKSVG